MADVASRNAALMCRIVQLEHERDELQKDIETLCLQKSGVPESMDVATRMQARRATGLEQELEACKEKVALLTRDNHNLQEELTEAYRVKGRIADAFKAAIEKNSQVEKEVKFFQSKVAAALAERDKAVVEVERVHENAKTTAAKLQDLYNRLDEATAEYKELGIHCGELEKNADSFSVQLGTQNQVLERFWKLRVTALGHPEEDEENQALQPLDKAKALLDDAETQWTYGESWQRVEEVRQQAVEVESELATYKEQLETVTSTFEKRLAEEWHARCLAEERASSYKVDQGQAEEKASSVTAQLEHLKENMTSKLQQVHSAHRELKTEIAGLLEEEGKWLDSMWVGLQAVMDLSKAVAIQQEPVDKFEEERGPPRDEGVPPSEASPSEASPSSEEIEEVPSGDNPDENKDSMSPLAAADAPQFGPENIEEDPPGREAIIPELMITQEGHFSAAASKENSSVDVDVDDYSRKALAQALHEKVEALLLLSQQEERYYMESKTIQALEDQIKELNEKIAQVTSEKVSALLEVAQLRQDGQFLEERERQLVRILQQHRSTSASGRLLPASWSEARVPPSILETTLAVVKHGAGTKSSLSATGGYLKSWLRGLEISGPGLKGSSDPSNCSSVSDVTKSSQANEAIGFATLRVENAALQERVAGVLHLTESAHRLRMTLVRAASDSQNEQTQPSIRAAVDVVEGVSVEARRLKVALGCSLPVSWSDPESGRLEADGTGSLSSNKTIISSVEGKAHAALDIASAAGMEMVELLLATSELQKAALMCRLGMLSH